MSGHPLDDPVLSSLRGTHAHLAEGDGAAIRYLGHVSPFASFDPRPDGGGYNDVARLVGRGNEVLFAGLPAPAPDGWDVVASIEGVQMSGDRVAAVHDPETVRLGADDVPEMLDLVERTRPGPFRKRTVEMGVYLGIRHEGALVAMAGERMRPDGYTEISAVCTDPGYRGRGLGARLIRAVAAVVRDRDEVPFLHAASVNVGAIRLYEALGFQVRRPITFTVLRVPAA